jgi:hypothetical protein
MKQMMFTKGVEDAVIEINNDKEGEGQSDDKERTDPVPVEDNASEDECEDDASDDEAVEEDEPWNDVTTRSGQSVRAPSRLIAELGASALGLTKSE